jgi:hypothetical protein
MGCILEGIKFSLADMHLVIDEDLGDFLKDLDDKFLSNLRLPEFELEEEYIV